MLFHVRLPVKYYDRLRVVRIYSWIISLVFMNMNIKIDSPLKRAPEPMVLISIQRDLVFQSMAGV